MRVKRSDGSEAFWWEWSVLMGVKRSDGSEAFWWERSVLMGAKESTSTEDGITVSAALIFIYFLCLCSRRMAVFWWRFACSPLILPGGVCKSVESRWCVFFAPSCSSHAWRRVWDGLVTFWWLLSQQSCRKLLQDVAWMLRTSVQCFTVLFAWDKLESVWLTFRY